MLWSVQFYPLLSSSSWAIDSGASNHMTSMEQILRDPKPYIGTEQIVVFNGRNLSIASVGSIFLHRRTNFLPCPMFFLFVNFSSSSCVIQDWCSVAVVKTSSKHVRTFLLDILGLARYYASSSSWNKFWTTWHRCVGHLHNDRLYLFFLRMVIWTPLIIIRNLPLYWNLIVFHVARVRVLIYLF